MNIKTLQIINAIIIGIYSFISIQLLFSFSIVASKSTIPREIFMGIIVISICLILWLVLLILSFKKTNIKNKYFKISSIINLIISIVLFIALYCLIYPTDFLVNNVKIQKRLLDIMQNLLILILLLFAISFIIFLIGYFKNRIKNKFRKL